MSEDVDEMSEDIDAVTEDLDVVRWHFDTNSEDIVRRANAWFSERELVSRVSSSINQDTSISFWAQISWPGLSNAISHLQSAISKRLLTADGWWQTA